MMMAQHIKKVLIMRAMGKGCNMNEFFKHTYYVARDDVSKEYRENVLKQRYVQGDMFVEEKDLKLFNINKYGIHFTVNGYYDMCRKIGNVAKINAWYSDVDKENKELILEKVSKAKIKPSCLIETMNGFHMYWYADNTATKTNYKRIVGGVNTYFGADVGVKDITRTLRLPGYYQWKDVNNPYLVKEFKLNDVYQHNVYTEQDMLRAYGLKDNLILDQYRSSKVPNPEKKEVQQYDVEKGLLKLSGVLGETYEIEDKGEYKRIIVNGKESSAWIDKEAKIGSWKRSGPTLYEWIGWYVGQEHGKIMEVYNKYLKEV